MELKQWGTVGVGVLIVGLVAAATFTLLPSVQPSRQSQQFSYRSEPLAVPTLPADRSPSANVKLTVNNSTTEVICSLYVSRTEDWGDDRLGETVLMPKQIWEMQVMRGFYRLQARNCFDYVLAEERTFIDQDTEWLIVSAQVLATVESE